MRPLCSFLIPSRNRFDLLKRCVKSIFDTAEEAENVEVVIRLHKSDTDSIFGHSEILQDYPNSRIIFGEDLSGYKSLGKFYEELTEKATGQWHCQMNDDMMLFGENGAKWDLELLKKPQGGFLIQPEIHKLNRSTYLLDEKSPCPFYPAGSLAKFGLKEFPVDIDRATHKTLIEVAGWKVDFLKNIGAKHDWKGISEFA